METAVRKATRLEFRPPKEKHLLTLKNMTFENPASIDGILMSLEKRLKERSWIITFKVLVIVHYLMREGNCVRVVDGVIKRPSVLDASRIKNKSSTPANIHNIYLYRAYLDERVIAFRHLKRDFVTETSTTKEGRLRHLLVSEGLLKETAALQRQLESALKCKFYLDESDPSITFFAYRMTTEDLLALFQAVNEGVVNILEHYFELNKTDATAALEVYKTFAQQTELTISYLNEARKVQDDLQMNIPAIKHAPLSLAAALEEYLNDGASAATNKKTDQAKALPPPISTQQTQPVQLQLSIQQQPALSIQQQQPFQQQQAVPQQQPQAIQYQQQQPIFNQAIGVQPQIQNDPFNGNSFSSSYNTDQSMDAFSPNRQSFASPQQTASSPLQHQPLSSRLQQQSISSPLQQQPMSPTQNPFLAIMNQQQQQAQPPTYNNFKSPFATVGHGVSTSPNNQFMSSGSATFSGATSTVNSSNPFRSLVNNTTPSEFQQPQQIAVIKPVPYQPPQSPVAHNPFSPVTPPLTPNQQLNIFMPPQQQQLSMSPAAPNPFMNQQHNVFSNLHQNPPAF